MCSEMIVYKLLIMNSSLFILDSAIDGYMRTSFSFFFILILYVFSLVDFVFFGYLYLRRKEKTEQRNLMYYRTSKGYVCREHGLYNMDYIQATSHFGLQHDMILNEVE